MALTTTTHLNLPGTAQSALNHYQEVFGGEVSITTYAQVGMPAEAPGSDKVVFGLLESATGLRLMAYDIPGQEQLNTEPLGGKTAPRSPISPSSWPSERIPSTRQ